MQKCLPLVLTMQAPSNQKVKGYNKITLVHVIFSLPTIHYEPHPWMKKAGPKPPAAQDHIANNRLVLGMQLQWGDWETESFALH